MVDAGRIVPDVDGAVNKGKVTIAERHNDDDRADLFCAMRLSRMRLAWPL